jgi:hypothetical protein
VFDEVAGLPAHPLMVHAPVILVPLTMVVAIAYTVIPAWRSKFGWALGLLAIAAPVTAFAATLSGEVFAVKRGIATAPQVAIHSNLGATLRNLTILVAVLAIALLIVERVRTQGSVLGNLTRAGRHQNAGAGPMPSSPVLLVASIVLALGLVGVSIAATVWVVRTGHTGALMVWSDEGG